MTMPPSGGIVVFEADFSTVAVEAFPQGLWKTPDCCLLINDLLRADQ